MRNGRTGLGLALAIARSIARAAGRGGVATAVGVMLALGGCTSSHVPGGGDLDRDGYTEEAGDCDDERADVNPEGDDSCGPPSCEAYARRDGVDQDCDGRIDEACTPVTNCFWDAGPPYDAGVDSDGDGWTAGADCNDADPAIHPGATERCTMTCEGTPAVDEDCDGLVDEDCHIALNCFYDADGDGYGSGFGPGPDCDDTDPAIHPGAVEYCFDGIDQNCDGVADEEGCVVANGMADAPDDGVGEG